MISGKAINGKRGPGNQEKPVVMRFHETASQTEVAASAKDPGWKLTLNHKKKKKKKLVNVEGHEQGVG